MLGLSLDSPRRATCSGRHFNCGAHALTHIFVKNLLDGTLDDCLETPHYQNLLTDFKLFHNLQDNINFNWDSLKKIFCHYAHPIDREIILGDVFRQFFTNISADNIDYKNSRKEYFQMIATAPIERNLAAWPSMVSSIMSNCLSWIGWTDISLEQQDLNVDSEFLKIPSIAQFINEITAEFNQLNEEQKCDRINAFWDASGFNAWLQYINTPGVMLPIDILMNGAAALNYDVSIIIAGGHNWHNQIENPDGSFNPRPFSMKAFNTNGSHYEVELDSEIDAKVHNLQFTYFHGIDEDGEKVIANLQEAGIHTGGLQSRKISEEMENMPINFNLSFEHVFNAAEQIIKLTTALGCASPEKLEQNIIDNNFNELYLSRKRLYPLQFKKNQEENQIEINEPPPKKRRLTKTETVNLD